MLSINNYSKNCKLTFIKRNSICSQHCFEIENMISGEILSGKIKYFPLY